MDQAAVASDMIAKSAQAVRDSERLVPSIVRVAELIDAAFRSGHRLYVCGNGGSAADAQHFVAELVGRFTRERTAYPAIALTTNTSVLTAVANDYEFAEVFARQVRALVRSGDVLVGISTSGKSENVIRALASAPSGTTRVALMGASGPMAARADVVINAPGRTTAEIQSAHIALVHAICAVLDMLAND
jgi:D-sedoheptulose 7-phosphate isomerase